MNRLVRSVIVVDGRDERRSKMQLQHHSSEPEDYADARDSSWHAPEETQKRTELHNRERRQEIRNGWKSLTAQGAMFVWYVVVCLFTLVICILGTSGILPLPVFLILLAAEGLVLWRFVRRNGDEK